MIFNAIFNNISVI